MNNFVSAGGVFFVNRHCEAGELVNTLFPQWIVFPSSRKSYHEYGDIGHRTEQIFYIILNGIGRIYGVAKVQKARYDPKGTFPLMLCHVLCHPVITMSSYISGFL